MISTSRISPLLVMIWLSKVCPSLAFLCSRNVRLCPLMISDGGCRIRWCCPIISDFSRPTNLAAALLQSIKIPVSASAKKIASMLSSNCLRYFSSDCRRASSSFLLSVMFLETPKVPIIRPSLSVSGIFVMEDQDTVPFAQFFLSARSMIGLPVLMISCSPL